MARNNRILVPEAREELDDLKRQVQAKQGYSADRADNGYKGDMTAKEAGSLGGPVGGQMVHELIQIAEQSLDQKQQR